MVYLSWPATAGAVVFAAVAVVVAAVVSVLLLAAAVAAPVDVVLSTSPAAFAVSMGRNTYTMAKKADTR